MMVPPNILDDLRAHDQVLFRTLDAIGPDRRSAYQDNVLIPFVLARLQLTEILSAAGVKSVVRNLSNLRPDNPRIVLQVELADARNGVMKINSPRAEMEATQRWHEAGATVPEVIWSTMVPVAAFLMPFDAGVPFIERVQDPRLGEGERLGVIKAVVKTLALGHPTTVSVAAMPWSEGLAIEKRIIEETARWFPDVLPPRWRDWVERVENGDWELVSSHGDLHPQNILVESTTGKLKLVIDVNGSERPNLSDVARLIVDVPPRAFMHATAVSAADAYGTLDARDLDLFIGYESIAAVSRILLNPSYGYEARPQVLPWLKAAETMVEHGATVRQDITARLDLGV